MPAKKQTQNPETNKISLHGVKFPLAFLALGLFVYILIQAKSLLLPLVMAIGLWYLINAIAKRFARLDLGGFKIPGFFCYLAAIAALGAGIYLIIDLISRNIAANKVNNKVNTCTQGGNGGQITKETGNFKSPKVKPRKAFGNRVDQIP